MFAGSGGRLPEEEEELPEEVEVGAGFGAGAGAGIGAGVAVLAVPGGCTGTSCGVALAGAVPAGVSGVGAPGVALLAAGTERFWSVGTGLPSGMPRLPPGMVVGGVVAAGAGAGIVIPGIVLAAGGTLGAPSG